MRQIGAEVNNSDFDFELIFLYFSRYKFILY